MAVTVSASRSQGAPLERVARQRVLDKQSAEVRDDAFGNEHRIGHHLHHPPPEPIMRRIPPSMSLTTEGSRNHQSDEQIILRVDTHKDTHVASVITILGVLVATATFPTTTAGYRELLGWAHSFGGLCRAGVEGTDWHASGPMKAADRISFSATRRRRLSWPRQLARCPAEA